MLVSLTQRGAETAYQVNLRSFSKILVVAPHADDETLGAGGLIHRLVKAGSDVTVAVMTGRGGGSHPLFEDEVFTRVRSEFDQAMGVLNVSRTVFADLPTTLLSETPVHLVNRAARDLVTDHKPDLVLLPFEHDLHRDHGIINYAFLVALRPHLADLRRPHLVASYEVPSETHLQAPYLRAGFEPQLWLDISDSLSAKLEALACFGSQIGPAPGLRSLQTVEALARWRGAQIGTQAAEAFVVLRQVI